MNKTEKNVFEEVDVNYRNDVFIPTLDLMFLQIKFYNQELENLKNHKPFWFMKKSLVLYNNKIKKIHDNLDRCYRIIGNEINYFSN